MKAADGEKFGSLRTKTLPATFALAALIFGIAGLSALWLLVIAGLAALCALVSALLPYGSALLQSAIRRPS